MWQIISGEKKKMVFMMKSNKNQLKLTNSIIVKFFVFIALLTPNFFKIGCVKHVAAHQIYCEVGE